MQSCFLLGQEESLDEMATVLEMGSSKVLVYWTPSGARYSQLGALGKTRRFVATVSLLVLVTKLAQQM
jgi:hypothetical protein